MRPSAAREPPKGSSAGLLCEPNPEAMALELLLDGDLRERRAGNALAWAREFGWERSAGEVLKAVEDILGKVICI